VIVLMILSPLLVFAQGLTMKDDFPNGRPELRWAPFPFFNRDNIEGIRDIKAPGGENGIGLLGNRNAGGFASLSYAVTRQVQNFYLEVMLYCPVTGGDKGPLAGIAFLVDPIGGNFYRIVCDFKTNDPTLNLAYVGNETRNFPVCFKFWDEREVPGGIPKESGWHKMAVRVKDGKATAYWDGRELKGGPLMTDRIRRGFAGVYANFVGGLGEATAKVDNFLLKEE
jgi:hypothetical protein